MKTNQKLESELLDKFKGIGFLDYDVVNNKLASIETITEKLDYLKDLKGRYGGKYSTIFNSLESEQKDYYLNKFPITKEIISNKVVSPLHIPESIYEEHFKDGLNIPEFTFWFLKFNAQLIFEVEKEINYIEKKLISPLRNKFIDVELKKLNDFENEADKKLDNNKIEIYDQIINEYSKETEYQRIKADYYKTHPLPDVHAIGNLAVSLYAKHIYFKNYLLEKQKEPNQIDKNKNDREKERFKDLFVSTELYDRAVKILVEKEYIKQFNSNLKWIFTPTKEYTTNQTIIALCVVLEKKQYFKYNLKAIYNNIENEFDIKIDKGTYSKSSNGFKEDYDKPITTNYKYTSLFKDIL